MEKGEPTTDWVQPTPDAAFFAFLKEIYCTQCVKKLNQSHYRPEVPRGFHEVKVPRLRDNGPIYIVYKDK